MNDLMFFEDSHQYLYKGVLIPCVSEIIGFVFPDTYKNIPQSVISAKGKYGTKVHNLVEQYLKGETTIEEIENMNIDPNIKSSLRQFVKEERNWELDSIEQSVCYQGRYAGTYDILTKDGYIIDIKSTAAKTQFDLIDSNNEAKLNGTGELAYDKKLNLQISLYYLAKGIKRDFGYLKWLPKGGIIGKGYPKVACWPEEKLIEVLNNYEKQKKQSL